MNLDAALKSFNGRYQHVHIEQTNGRSLQKCVPIDENLAEHVDKHLAEYGSVKLLPYVKIGGGIKLMPMDVVIVDNQQESGLAGGDNNAGQSNGGQPQATPQPTPQQMMSMMPMDGAAIYFQLWQKSDAEATALRIENNRLRDELSEAKSELKSSQGLAGGLSSLAGIAGPLFGIGGMQGMGTTPQGALPQQNSDNRVAQFSSWFSNQEPEMQKKVWLSIQLMRKNPELIDNIIQAANLTQITA